MTVLVTVTDKEKQFGDGNARGMRQGPGQGKRKKPGPPHPAVAGRDGGGFGEFNQMRSDGHKTQGFTLVEMLAVIAIVSILAALLLPTLGRTQAKARRVQCLANLQQTGVGFHSFLHDHTDNFPMQVSTNAGGTAESLLVGYRAGVEFYFSYTHFQALSNDLATPRIFACPTDGARTA